MQKEYANKLIEEIKILNEMKVSELLLDKFSGQTLSDIKLGIFSGEKFATCFHKMTKNFINQFDSDNWNFWAPKTFDTNSNHVDLFGVVKALRQNLNTKDFLNAENCLWSLINFQILYGFWNEKNTYSFKQTKLNEMLASLDERKKLYDSNIAVLIENAAILETEVLEKAERLDNIDEKESELDSILQNAQEVNKKHEDVNSKILALKEANEKAIADLQKALNDANDFREEIEKTYDKTINLEKTAKEAYKFISDKAKESTDLVGKTSDNSLGFSFGERKKELLWSVRSWKYLWIPSYFVLACAWFYFSYNYITVNVENEFAKILVFTGKLSLSLYIIYFALKEYVKERKLLEEYSFKTAVALTVNAYGDQIGQANHLSDNDEDVSDILDYRRQKEVDRQGFIKETVITLYQVPKYSDKLDAHPIKNAAYEVSNKISKNVSDVVDKITNAKL